MSTLADELLQDFEDSGSENGEEHHDADPDVDADADASGALEADGFLNPRRTHNGLDTDMMLDGDEEEESDEEDEVMSGTGAAPGLALDTTQDEAAAKAQVEKMQLGSVKDIRKVTRLMDRLEPLLKVSHPFPRSSLHLGK